MFMRLVSAWFSMLLPVIPVFSASKRILPSGSAMIAPKGMFPLATERADTSMARRSRRSSCALSLIIGRMLAAGSDLSAVWGRGTEVAMLHGARLIY